jgi:ABC-type sugar transport system substrate-binding protein
MKASPRLDKIVSLIDENSFLTVTDLSRLCDVSEMTIRRDLDQLQEQNRILRTFGGAVSVRAASTPEDGLEGSHEQRAEVLLVDQVDVLIGTSVNPYYDNLLIDRATKKDIAIIAESIEMPNQRTVVAVDNYQGGFDLGSWTGKYLKQNGVKKVNLLDLTFHQPNTQNRSRGFADGLGKATPQFETVLSINAQSRYATAYQLSKDALIVHPQINLIFAINDTTAWGAINACRDLGIDPGRMTIVTFGLEG